MSNYNFVHLHNHTEYSILDGMISLNIKREKNLIKKAKEYGMNAVAITDHGNMYGVIEFYKACKEYKIKPIIGVEFYIASGSRFDKNSQKDNSHILLIAKNLKGYNNLIKLSSLAFLEGFYYNPRIDRELLEKYNEGLICLSACLSGEIPKLILQDKIEEAEKLALYYQELFGKDSFFLEMQIHGIKEEKIVAKSLYAMSKKLKIPLVATNDCHYLEKEDAEAHDVLLCIGTKKKLSDSNRMKLKGDSFYFKSEEEMAKIFSEIPKALSNTQIIAEMCDLKIDLPGPVLPDFKVPENKSKEEYLKELAINGLKERYGEINKELMERLESELTTINKMGFAGYFLIVADFVNFAKKNNIWVGPGRGSGAGSLVAYSLGITNLDPLPYDLLFERFLHEYRYTMPDFDIDFCQERREEVINYVINKYSKEKVSQIVTFSKMKPKAVIKDVGRALDIPFSRVNEISKLIPDKIKSFKSMIEESPELKEIAQNGSEIEKKLLEISEKLEGITRHTSVHAAGIVIGKEEITNYVPLQIVKEKKSEDIITTQIDGRFLEDCGLVKMDFLGLITLTVMRNCVELLAKRGISLDINKIPLDDQEVFGVFAKGDTDGIFQFESPGMKKYLKKLKPTCLQDLIAMNALYRPGPMKYIDNYIARKHLKESVEYDHPLIEPILKETYGIIVYQEQVMKIAQVLAGYDLGSADMLRRAMGKKKREEMEAHKKIFVYGNKDEIEKIKQENLLLKEKGEKEKKIPKEIKGAINNGVDEATAKKIFEKMEEFADYGFNKSHAAAYSYLAYQTAYLKKYYPVEFMASLINSEIGKPDKLLDYLTILNNMNIKLLPPDINKSFMRFTVEDGAIRYGLTGIKGVGDAAAFSIVNARNDKNQFVDFFDFLVSVDLRVVNKAVLEILIKIGAFDSLNHSRKDLLDNLDTYIEEAQELQRDKNSGQISLFDNIEISKNDKNKKESPDFTFEEKLKMERDIAGIYFSGHPLDPYKYYIKKNGFDSIKTIEKKAEEIKKQKNSFFEFKFQTYGIMVKHKINLSSDNKKWAIVTIEDFKSSKDFYIFNNKFEQLKDKLQNNKPIIIKGVCKMKKEDGFSYVIEEILDLQKEKEKETSEYHIYLKNVEAKVDELTAFKFDLLNLNGSLPLYFHIKEENGQETIIKSDTIFAPNDQELSLAFVEKYKFIEKIKIL